MVAYIVFTRERTRDQAELDTYSKKVSATLTGHAVTTRAYYGRQEVLEGAAVEGVVILEFPTFEEAKAWYDSPAYRKVRERARTTAPSSSKASNGEEFYERWRTLERRSGLLEGRYHKFGSHQEGQKQGHDHIPEEPCRYREAFTRAISCDAAKRHRASWNWGISPQ